MRVSSSTLELIGAQTPFGKIKKGSVHETTLESHGARLSSQEELFMCGSMSLAPCDYVSKYACHLCELSIMRNRVFYDCKPVV